MLAVLLQLVVAKSVSIHPSIIAPLHPSIQPKQPTIHPTNRPLTRPSIHPSHPLSPSPISCGGGQRCRHRSVAHVGTGADAHCRDTRECETCNRQSCSSVCQVGEWSAWSTCSATCVFVFVAHLFHFLAHAHTHLWPRCAFCFWNDCLHVLLIGNASGLLFVRPCFITDSSPESVAHVH
jgi:hypothetical protein